MPARASNPAAGDGPAGWRGSYRPLRPHAPSGQRNGFGARMPVPRELANPDRPRGRASQPGHHVPDHRHGSQEVPGRSADAIAAQIHREATCRPRPRRPGRNPIRIGAAGAAGVVEAAVHVLAVRVQAAVQADLRGRADGSN